MTDTSGWSRSEMFVMEALERIEHRQNDLHEMVDKRFEVTNEKIADIRVNVERKGAVWGALSGLVMGIVAVAVAWMKGE